MREYLTSNSKLVPHHHHHHHHQSERTTELGERAFDKYDLDRFDSLGLQLAPTSPSIDDDRDDDQDRQAIDDSPTVIELGFESVVIPPIRPLTHHHHHRPIMVAPRPWFSTINVPRSNPLLILIDPQLDPILKPLVGNDQDDDAHQPVHPSSHHHDRIPLEPIDRWTFQGSPRVWLGDQVHRRSHLRARATLEGRPQEESLSL